MNELELMWKLTLEWWDAHKNGGVFRLSRVPPEVAAFGMWCGWFRINGNRLIVPKKQKKKLRVLTHTLDLAALGSSGGTEAEAT